MAIHYVLHKNNLTPDQTDFAARVKSLGTVRLERIIEKMIEQGSTTTRSDIRAVLEDAIMASESMLVDGFRVNFGGMVELFPRVKGVFTGAADEFDPARHDLDIGANPGAQLRKAVRGRANVIKDESSIPSPNLVEYFDVSTETSDDRVTPASIGQITGHRMKFDPDRSDEGIFFMPVGGGDAVRVVTVQENNPSQLVFLIPSLPPGSFHLQVRARIDGGSELRSGELKSVLTVS